MKKYLLGLFAIVLAVGFSAFTPSTSGKVTTTQEYLWQETDDFGNLVLTTNGGQVSSTLLDVSEAQSEFDCDPGEKYCARAVEEADGQIIPGVFITKE
jgi:hypothetical protein